MSTAQHVIALLKSHLEGDETRFLSIATQVAAREARQGHANVARELKELIDRAKNGGGAIQRRPGPLPIAQPRGELASLLSVTYPDLRVSKMVLPSDLALRLQRVLREQKQQNRLRTHGLQPRRKLLLIGPPGSGKTMTAAALAGELKLPLFTILLEGVITKFMGETASKLRLIFDAMQATRGVYLFDEFDAIGARRTAGNDVGEIRRVLNSFLQFLENDESQGLVIAATNHAELLDPALFRRFDDVIEYVLPDASTVEGLLHARLATFSAPEVDWAAAATAARGLSQADVARAADDAAKTAILAGRSVVETSDLLAALEERKRTSR